MGDRCWAIAPSVFHNHRPKAYQPYASFLVQVGQRLTPVLSSRDLSVRAAVGAKQSERLGWVQPGRVERKHDERHDGGKESTVKQRLPHRRCRFCHRVWYVGHLALRSVVGALFFSEKIVKLGGSRQPCRISFCKERFPARVGGQVRLANASGV